MEKVTNQIVKKESKKQNEMVFMANGCEVTLKPETVRDYLVSGDKERVSMQEIVMFMNMCKFNGLNPWLKECYCIKYGSEPATIVTGKDAFLKRAESNENFDGYEAGIIVQDKDGSIANRDGAFFAPDESIVGGWANVYRKDREHPVKIEVSFDEYAGRKKDGSLNRTWSSKPGTMIRKIALVQALRESFPTMLSGMYSEEESSEIPEDIHVSSQVVEEEKSALEILKGAESENV